MFCGLLLGHNIIFEKKNNPKIILKFILIYFIIPLPLCNEDNYLLKGFKRLIYSCHYGIKILFIYIFFIYFDFDFYFDGVFLKKKPKQPQYQDCLV